MSQSVYGITGFVAGPDDLRRAEEVLRRSLPVLRQFASVVLATNFGDHDRDVLSRQNAELFRSYLPECVLIDSRVNRGHSIGTSDLDLTLFDHCRATDAEWICKGATDVLLDEQVLDLPIEDADFYFLNAVSHAALAAHDFDLALFRNGFLFPQTTFYALRVPAVDVLIDRSELDRAWTHVSSLPDYNDRIWEHLPGWSCEGLLRGCVERNSLRTFHLMTGPQWDEMLALVVDRRIEDCSFKGIWINGICHAQGLKSLDAPLAVIGRP